MGSLRPNFSALEMEMFWLFKILKYGYGWRPTKVQNGKKKGHHRSRRASEGPRKTKKKKVKPVQRRSKKDEGRKRRSSQSATQNCPNNICSPPLAKSSMHKTVIRIRTL